MPENICFLLSGGSAWGTERITGRFRCVGFADTSTDIRYANAFLCQFYIKQLFYRLKVSQLVLIFKRFQ